MTDAVDIDTLAGDLYQAWRTSTAIPQLSLRTSFDLAAAYRIQARAIDARVEAGETGTGFKMGFTSKAKMAQMGVAELICGRLTSGMAIADGGTLDPATVIHPRIEPEVVFLLGRDLDPEESVESAVSAVEAVAAGLEIIDSRYADFKFSLADVVADNASSSGYVVGNWCPPEADLGNRGVVLDRDGVVIETGSTAAILGDPWRAFRSAVTLSRKYGVDLVAGDIVLAGAATAAAPFLPGTTVRATVAGLGTVSVQQGVAS